MRRSKGYQDLDEGGETTQKGRAPLPAMGPVQEIEMATVSVVPDGNLLAIFLLTGLFTNQKININTPVAMVWYNI